MNLNPKSLGRSTSVTIVLVTFVTVVGELSAPFKDLLADFTGHHWVTKSVISVVVFAVTYALLAKSPMREGTAAKEIAYVIAASILGGIALFAYYLAHSLLAG